MRTLCSIFCLFMGYLNVEANNIQVVKDGPIHEAFVTQESGTIFIQAVPDRPPAPLTEDAPRVGRADEEWIPGYWAWNRDIGRHVWVSGVWRKPPPGHQWIRGRWKNYQFGWVWFKGFWSPTSLEEIDYIDQPPPDPINETVALPASSVKAFFWAPGQWEWRSDSQTYQWMRGRWDLMGDDRIYVPGQYYWREEGYIFVPSFWDWPIEERGTAYAAISVPLEEVETFVYEPSVELYPLYIMEQLFPYWPNYATLFRFHFYFHHALWAAWGPIPPWWNWTQWWALPAQDAWWLWWWWSHPGYPNPSWITADLAAKITPPNQAALTLMQNIQPPPNVTPNGTIGPKELIDAITIATGKTKPILSSDPKQVEQVQDLADPTIPKIPYLRPHGKGKVDTSPQKPSGNGAAPEQKLAPGRVKLPLGDYKGGQNILDGREEVESEEKPLLKMRKDKGAPFLPPENQSSFKQDLSFAAGEIALYQRMPPNTGYTPPSPYRSGPSGPPGYGVGPQLPSSQQHTPGPYAPQKYGIPPHAGMDTRPYQGYQPTYVYPQPKMHMQHHDHLMTTPQPQRNPAGPKAHPYPFDESTLPYY